MAIAPVLKTGGPKGPCRFESYALRSTDAIPQVRAFGRWVHPSRPPPFFLAFAARATSGSMPIPDLRASQVTAAKRRLPTLLRGRGRLLIGNGLP